MEKRLKGFFCPDCRGHRLHVVSVRRAAPFVIVRYRECTICNYAVKSKETIDGAYKQTPEHIAKRIKSMRARRRKHKKCPTT